MDEIKATLAYAVDTGVKPVNETFADGDIRRSRTGQFDYHEVAVRNGRTRDDLSLERNGFERIDHNTEVTNFFEPDQIRGRYQTEMEGLVARMTGARRVVMFDHTLRSGSLAEREERKIREPVLSVHNDYTEWSGPQRVRDLLPAESDDLLSRRFAIIQVWRAIDRPIQSNPLGMIDARTVVPQDLIAAERRYPNRVGETYQVKFNPAHAWYYFPMLRRDEAIIFKVYDSLKDGRARFTPHSAFADPTTPADAPPRQSIEIRTIAFF